MQYQSNDWQGGFTANITIKNTGDAWTSWTLKFDFPLTTTKYTNGWSAGSWGQSGSTVTATNAAWNGAIANGGSTSIGFQGTWSGTNPKPTSFTVNGVTCGGATQTTSSTTSSSSSTTTSSSSSTTTTSRTTSTTSSTTTTTRPSTTTTTTSQQSSGQFYVDPNSAAARWVAANPNDSRTSVISAKVAKQSLGHWETQGTRPDLVQGTTSAYVSAAAAAGQIPVIVAYALPNRDCGGASAGGSTDLSQYAQWIQGLARGLGNQPVYVALEPDGLALQTCLSAAEATARDNAVAQAVTTIKNANPNAKVYLDAGHSRWNSAAVTAQRLQAAGVAQANGFFTNVSNFNATANEVSFGQSVLNIIGGGKKMIIDTSRNGVGTNGSTDWCDDNTTAHRIGSAPTTNTGNSAVDAFIWVKPPGELDGCGGAAGSFVAQKAYQLAGGS